MTDETKIEEIERRLRELAEQLNAAVDNEKASELVREAARLAGQAGEEVSRALAPDETEQPESRKTEDA